jgi:hypothetical protein
VTKRPLSRRTEEDQIRELQQKVDELKAQLEAKSRKDLPVVQAWPKVQRVLRQFVQVATDHHRTDIAISAQAFMAGVDRSLDPEVMAGKSRRGRRAAGDAGDDWDG